MPDWRVAAARAATVSGNCGRSASLKLVDIWIKSVRSGTRRWLGSGPWLKRRRSNDKHWPRLQAPKEVDHGSADLRRTFLLGPMAAARQHDRRPELGNHCRLLCDRLGID